MSNAKEEIEKELKPNKPNFSVDMFEDLIIQDISQNDSDMQVKLNRDLTNYFNKWIKQKLDAKEQIKISVKGETRSGKSLIALKIMKKIADYYNKEFNTDKIVCANQSELKQKLQDADFGDCFQVDENAFARSGMGSNVESQQLSDINNIIAKQNIHMGYITPRTFLNVGSTLGLAYFGKDTLNWVSRFLLYSLKGASPVLLGYVVFDVGSLFRETGCYIYREIGGCTNPHKYTKDEIPEKHLNVTTCIPDDYDEDKIIDDKKTCPFYDVCTSAMAQYEHKKDKWIDKEMKGNLDERTLERYKLSVKIMEEMGVYDEENDGLKLSAKNKKDFVNKVTLKLPTMTNTKFTISEQNEIISILESMSSIDFFKNVCSVIGENAEEKIQSISRMDR